MWPDPRDTDALHVDERVPSHPPQRPKPDRSATVIVWLLLATIGLVFVALVVASLLSAPRSAAESAIPTGDVKGIGAGPALASSGNLAQQPSEAPQVSGRAALSPSGALPPVSPTPAALRGSPAPPLGAQTVLRGVAAWCAPTATRCRSWGGHVLLGAVRSFRWGDRPYRVRVVHGSRSVIVTVVSYCACGGNRVIDLSPWAFSKLAPLSAGLVRVRVLR